MAFLKENDKKRGCCGCASLPLCLMLVLVCILLSLFKYNWDNGVHVLWYKTSWLLHYSYFGSQQQITYQINPKSESTRTLTTQKQKQRAAPNGRSRILEGFRVPQKLPRVIPLHHCLKSARGKWLAGCMAAQGKKPYFLFFSFFFCWCSCFLCPRLFLLFVSFFLQMP